MKLKVDLQPIFMCGAMLVALLFLMLPAFYLPGWETPESMQHAGQFVREKFSIRNRLSEEHLRRLKRLFAKRKKKNASLLVPAAASDEHVDELDERLEALLERRHGAHLTSIYQLFDASALGQAQLLGLVATTPPPPPRKLTMTGAARLACLAAPLSDFT